MTPDEDKHILHQRRRAGILLHPTSLPGPLPRGLICHDAYRFIEWLSQSGIRVWQMLPVGMTHDDGSPYQALSAHACETSLISLDWLSDRGLLDKGIRVSDFAAHAQRLETAWLNFQKHRTTALYKEYLQFCEQHAYWLDDFALFMAIREQQGNRAWTDWPADLRDRNAKALAVIKNSLADRTGYYRFGQYIFFQQWHGLKQYANKHDVLLFGDLPIYVALDSADVWAHRELFLLDETGQPLFVAGVPPDYFSDTGQRWGNPQYDWQAMQANNFTWWQQRIHTQLELFDVIRVDHFRGFQAYWEIEASAETAIDGRWVEAPGEALLQTLHDRIHALPLVAEDLGIITDEVTALRNQFGLPGMKILHFAFDGDAKNAYLPHNHEFNSVVYTGTHDNDTTLSWYQQLDDASRHYISSYLGSAGAEPMPWPLIRMAFASVSCLAVIPMQDVLALGQGQRMNTPGTSEGNWAWRFSWDQVADDLAGRLVSLCQLYDR